LTVIHIVNKILCSGIQRSRPNEKRGVWLGILSHTLSLSVYHLAFPTEQTLSRLVINCGKIFNRERSRFGEGKNRKRERNPQQSDNEIDYEKGEKVFATAFP